MRGVKNFFISKYEYSAFFYTKNHYHILKLHEDRYIWNTTLICFWKSKISKKKEMKVVIPRTVCREKIWFFLAPEMSFAFQTTIFGVKGLEIHTYSLPKRIWSYHIHVVNTSWPKWSKRPNLTFSSNFDVKNSIKSS